MASTDSTPDSEPPYTTCQLPMGYDGVLRIRAAPLLTLTPRKQSQPALRSLEDWAVLLGGTCKNVAEPIPCRLEWIIQSDLVPERRLPHPRETWLVPQGTTFQVQEKDAGALKPLRVSVLEFNLIGTGRLGYRIEPSVFGNDAVEVLPAHDAGVAFALKAHLTFNPMAQTFEEMLKKGIGFGPTRVGTPVKIEPDFCALFEGLQATLEIYPKPPEDVLPDAGATVTLTWIVGDTPALQRLLWKVGFAAVPGEHPGEWLQDHLLAVGGVETSPTVEFSYQLTLARPPPPAPEGKDKAKDKPAPTKDKKPAPPAAQLRPVPQPAVTVDRPRLKHFEVSLHKGVLGVSGSFEHFQDDVALDLALKPYVMLKHGEERAPEVVELYDYLKHLFLELLFADDQGGYTRGQRAEDAVLLSSCSEEDIHSRLAPLENPVVTSHQNAFELELLDLKHLPRKEWQTFAEIKNLEIFVVMAPAVDGADKGVPFWSLADYVERDDPQDTAGFAPFDSGAFVSRVFASGVCSANLVTAHGHSEELYSPMPAVPPERREEFEVFVGTVFGESVGQGPAAWAGVAHTIMNRVGRKYEIWEQCLSAAEVIQRTGFEAYQKPNYTNAITCMRAPAQMQLEFRDKVRAVIDVVTPIFMRRAGNLGGVVYFYSPALQRSLGRSTPGFVSQPGDKALERVTDKVLPKVAGDTRRQDFEFYAFKTPEKWPQMNLDELRQARAARGKGGKG